MINEVRNAVMAVINKNNYGYISPSDFNLFAEQAQLDIFEDYFYLYNNQLNAEVMRKSGTGYANITKGIIEVIDSFSVNTFLTQANANTYTLPSDYYLVDKIFYYSNVLTSGVSDTSGSLFDLTDIDQTFESTVQVGNLVVNTTDKTQAFVTIVGSNKQIRLSEDILSTAGKNYVIYSNTHIREVERVT